MSGVCHSECFYQRHFRFGNSKNRTDAKLSKGPAAGGHLENRRSLGMSTLTSDDAPLWCASRFSAGEQNSFGLLTIMQRNRSKPVRLRSGQALRITDYEV